MVASRQEGGFLSSRWWSTPVGHYTLAGAGMNGMIRRMTKKAEWFPESESHRIFLEELRRKAAEESAKLTPEEREARAINMLETVLEALSRPPDGTMD